MSVTESGRDRIPVRSAVRFPLHMEVLIRAEGADIHATTEDVSSTGILFTAATLPAVNSRIEFQMKMPAAIMGGTEAVLLQCVGRIVRHHQTAGKNMAAAVIDEYSLKAEPHEK
jgi:hypothetical protein